MKRRSVSLDGVPIVPALPAASTMLNKVPAVREFLTATAYDDGSARTPGYLTLRNRGHSFEVTLYDPDSGTRLPVRGKDFDTTLALAEQLLGVEEAPWEIDPFLTEQLTRKRKKAKK